jgi:hypothetical protein
MRRVHANPIGIIDQRLEGNEAWHIGVLSNRTGNALNAFENRNKSYVSLHIISKLVYAHVRENNHCNVFFPNHITKCACNKLYIVLNEKN